MDSSIHGNLINPVYFISHKFLFLKIPVYDTNNVDSDQRKLSDLGLNCFMVFKVLMGVIFN